MIRIIVLGLLLSVPSFATTLKITQGDTPTFTLTAKTGAGANFDLTGATFQTQVIGPRGTVVTFANSKHTADPDQVTNTGKFTLVLTASDTQSIAIGQDHEIVTKVTQGSLVTHFHAANILTVLPARPVK